MLHISTVAESSLKILECDILTLGNGEAMTKYEEFDKQRECAIEQMVTGAFVNRCAFVRILLPSFLGLVKQILMHPFCSGKDREKVSLSMNFSLGYACNRKSATFCNLFYTSMRSLSNMHRSVP